MNEFEEWLRARGLAPGTVRLYSGAVEAALRRWPGDLAQALEGLQPQRKETVRKALIRYAQFSGDMNLEARARAAAAPYRDLKPKVQSALTLRDEWPRLLGVLETREEPLRSVLLLIATTGLRLAEVLNLRVVDLQSLATTGRGAILQKGGSERYLAFAPEQQEWARKLLEAGGGAGPVWTLLLEGSRRERRAVEDYIRRELAQAGIDAGIERHVHPHMLRRVSGDAILDAGGGNMKLVQETLGHSDMKTTQRHYQHHGHQEQVADAMAEALRRAREGRK